MICQIIRANNFKNSCWMKDLPNLTYLSDSTTSEHSGKETNVFEFQIYKLALARKRSAVSRFTWDLRLPVNAFKGAILHIQFHMDIYKCQERKRSNMKFLRGTNRQPGYKGIILQICIVSEEDAQIMQLCITINQAGS